MSCLLVSMNPPPPPLYVEHRLPRGFRYFHEPLSNQHPADFLVGRQEQVRQFADRLAFSRGGAVLVTGFRGVGKTTFVHQALSILSHGRAEYEQILGPFRLLDVWVSLARPITAGQLMHLLVRQLFLTLRQRNLLRSLEGSLHRDLETAFLRTSFEVSRSSRQESEASAGLEKLLETAPLSISLRHLKSAEEMLRFLPYDDRAAEFDIVSLAESLASPGPRYSLFQRVRRRLAGQKWREDRRPPFKVIFVLDELDKLEASALDEILGALKTIFTSTAFSFVFIAGRELRNRWLSDISLGDSIYESIFAHDVYLSCLWSEQQDLASRFLRGSGKERADLERIELYLAYKGRGIPRRILRELNQFVVWRDREPWLCMDGETGRRVRMLAKLQETALELQAHLDSSRLEPLAQDSRWLAVYYVLDWVLTTGGAPFTVDQVQASALQLNLGNPAAMGIEAQFGRRIVEMLMHRGFLETARSTAVARDAEEAQEKAQYCLSAWVIDSLGKTGSPLPDPKTGLEGGALSAIDDYRLVEQIGAGGFSTVYRAIDRRGALRALKILSARWQEDQEAHQRFGREIALLRQLNHPNVVSFFDHGEFDGRPYIVMELVEGLALKEILARVGRLFPPFAVRIARLLAGAYAALHESGWTRVDAKPSNVMISSTGQLKVIDLGIVKEGHTGDTRITRSGFVVGSLDYISPEQLMGETIGVPSDVYSLATVLYEMLTGSLPFRQNNLTATVHAVLHREPVRPSTLVEIDPRLEQVILRGLSKKPEERFVSMEELSHALQPFERVADLASLVENVARAAQDITAGRSTRVEEVPEITETQAVPLLLDEPDPKVRRQALIDAGRDNPPEVFDLLFDFDQSICGLSGPEPTIRVLGEGRLILGRPGADVDLPLENLAVSRHHAGFFVSRDGVEVEDLGSSNGLLLSGEKVQRARLQNGSELRIGPVRLRIHIFGSPEGVGQPTSSSSAPRSPAGSSGSPR